MAIFCFYGGCGCFGFRIDVFTRNYSVKINRGVHACQADWSVAKLNFCALSLKCYPITKACVCVFTWNPQTKSRSFQISVPKRSDQIALPMTSFIAIIREVPMCPIFEKNIYIIITVSVLITFWPKTGDRCYDTNDYHLSKWQSSNKNVTKYLVLFPLCKSNLFWLKSRCWPAGCLTSSTESYRPRSFRA